MAIKHDGKEYTIIEKHQRYEWSEIKDALLTKCYKEGVKVSELARRFKASESVIARRLRVLDLVGEKLWTRKNDAILRSGYLTKANSEIAREVGCTTQYVIDRLTYLGLERRKGRK